MVKDAQLSSAEIWQAISLIFSDRREDALRSVPDDAIQEVIAIELSVEICWDIFGNTAAILNAKVRLTRCGAIPKLGVIST